VIHYSVKLIVAYAESKVSALHCITCYIKHVMSETSWASAFSGICHFGLVWANHHIQLIYMSPRANTSLVILDTAADAVSSALVLCHPH